jgi:multidrug efflux system membrane fusion protein
MKKRTVVAVVGVALCAGGFASWHVYGARSVPTAQTPAPTVPVVAEKLQASDVPIVMTGIGSVVAYNVVDVHAWVTGTIERSVSSRPVVRNSLIAQLDQRVSGGAPAAEATWRAIRQTLPTQGSILGASLRC